MLMNRPERKSWRMPTVYYQDIIQGHQASQCQAWDDWAMFDEMNTKKPKRRRAEDDSGDTGTAGNAGTG